MRHSGLTLALAISLAAGAAHAAPTASNHDAANVTPRAVYICDGSPETRRAMVRLHGSADYISADEAVAAQAAGEVWSAPRCMTDAEFNRLRAMQAQKNIVRVSVR